MTVARESEVIQARFLEVSAGWPSPPQILYDNQPAETPIRDGPWMRFAIRPGAERVGGFPGISPRRTFRIGRVEMQVFVPRGTGTAEIDRITDLCAGVFRFWRYADPELVIRCGVAECSALDDDIHLARRVSIPYESEQQL